MGEGGQKVHTSSYKISPGDVIYSMVTIVMILYYIFESCYAKRIDFKSSHHKKEKICNHM